MREVTRSYRFYLYLLLIIAYELKGYLYPLGSTTARVLCIVLIVWNSFCFFQVNFNPSATKPSYINVLNVLFLTHIVYGGLLLLSNDSIFIRDNMVVNYYYVRNILMSLLPIYSFYYYSEKSYLTIWLLQFLVPIFILVTFLSFQFNQISVASRMGVALDQELTNNVGYTFVPIIPLIYLCNYKNVPLRYSLLTICFVFVLLSFKRGAILIGAIITLLFIIKDLRQTSFRKGIIILVIVFGLFCLIYNKASFRIERSAYIQQRIEQTLSGNYGRNDIYNDLIVFIKDDASFLNLLVGKGANGSIKVCGDYAHNDWLEIAINQGLLGLIIYLFYWISFWREYKKGRKTRQGTVLFMFFILTFLMSLFSMSYANLSIYTSLGIGYCLNSITNTFNSEDS